AVAVNCADTHGMFTEPPRTSGPVSPSRGDHATLTGGHDLAWVEGPGRDVRASTHRPAGVGRPSAAGGVLHHHDPQRVAELPDRLEVQWDPALVNRDDRPRCWRERALDRVGRDVAGAR